jgi:dephospho-CoA kinase
MNTVYLPPFIGLLGRFCSGKGTVAKFLVEKFGYVEAAWSDALYEEVANSEGVTVEFMKANKAQYRSKLQEVGDGRRNQYGENYWINKFRERTAHLPLVVESGTRYPNEVEYGYHKGSVWYLDVPLRVCIERYEKLYGVLPTAAQIAHPSEDNIERLGRSAFVDTLEADCTLRELTERIEDLLLDTSFEIECGLYRPWKPVRWNVMEGRIDD